MPTSILLWAFIGLDLAVCGLALWKGGRAERLGALVILVNTFVFMAGDAVVPKPMIPLLLLADDAASALALLAITLRYASPWLGGAMLFYAAQFTLHSYYLVTERQTDLFHVVINNLNFIGVIFCLAIGTAIAWRRRARGAAPI
jgi:hypothetical protein